MRTIVLSQNELLIALNALNEEVNGLPKLVPELAPHEVLVALRLRLKRGLRTDGSDASAELSLEELSLLDAVLTDVADRLDPVDRAARLADFGELPRLRSYIATEASLA